LVFKKYDLSGDGEIDFKEFALIFFQNDPDVSPDKTESARMVASDPYL